MSSNTTAIHKVFRRSRVFLPVIHPVSRKTALASIQTAVAAEADGIFLINQGMTTFQLLDFIPEVRQTHPDLWIGVNLLGIPPEQVVRLVANLPVEGIWSDNAGIDELSDSQTSAERFQFARKQYGWSGLYFGGVAFKYQRPVPDARLPVAAQKATPWLELPLHKKPEPCDQESATIRSHSPAASALKT